MTRELSLVGLIAIFAGLGSFYATKEFGWFSGVNLVGGGACLLAAAASGLKGLQLAGGPASRRVVGRGLLLILAAVATATLLERAATWSDLRSDWTLERSFEPSQATLDALAALEETIVATLFVDQYDPRARRTRLLLKTLATHGDVEVRERKLDESPEEEDLYEVGSSNTVVVRVGDRFETVERPTEGALYEALYRLRSLESGVVTVLRGEGEGDLGRGDDLGYSGLAAALATEGYRLRSVVSAAMEEVPPETDVLLVIAPERALRAEAVAAIERFLLGGGRLVALLEPGLETGLEALLTDWGFGSPEAVLVDPAAGAVEGHPEGLCPIAFNYESHAITRGLGPNRMTLFCGARAFELRKPRIEDEVRRVVLSSGRSWLSEDLSLLEQRSGAPAFNGGRSDYYAIVAAGRYERNGREARVVAFGDADFAKNKNLRSLYNLDLILNAVHWAAQNDPEITLRPKIRSTVQFPLPLANTLRTLYGVGLLVPELLLIGGGLVWLRRRNS